jgi:rod shape-determining protein MreC
MELRRIKNRTKIRPLRAIVIAAVAFVLILIHFLGWLKPVENAFVFVTKPVVSGVTRAARSITGSFAFLGSIGHLASENDSLKQQVEKLQAEGARLSEVDKENTALRSQLKFQDKQAYNEEPSFVIGYDPTSFSEFITIDKGTESGIKNGNPVITDSGLLVGQIQDAGWKSSKVLLTTDSNSSINAVVQDSRASGIVKGDHGLGLTMGLIPQDEVVKAGDRVVTSGLGGEFPKGLVLGQVESVSEQANELFQTARLKPAISFRDVEIVFVIKSF